MVTKWIKSSGGVLVPIGTEHRANRRATTNYVELAQQAARIRSLYSQENVRIHQNSGLAQILAAGDALLIQSLSNTSTTDMSLIWKVLHLERIAKSLKSLGGHPQSRAYLKALKSGDLDFLQRKHSNAKNRLFELEVWRSLNSTGPFATLDEPDVNLSLQSLNIGFACKKIYSTAGVSKVLSNAVNQIRSNPCDFGLVAFNIDELLPAESIIKVGTYDQASDLLSHRCHDFLVEAERHLLRYFKQNDIIGAVASCSAIVDTIRQKPQFSNIQQWYIWTVPQLDGAGLSAARKVRDFLKCGN